MRREYEVYTVARIGRYGMFRHDVMRLRAFTAWGAKRLAYRRVMRKHRGAAEAVQILSVRKV